MTTLSELISWAKNIAKEYPLFREEIFDFISLCENEIEEGGSETHEVHLAYNDICDLVGLDQ